MSRRNVLILLGVIFSIPVIMKYWVLKEEISYEDTIRDYRQERNYFMRNSEQSPIRSDDNFDKLQYFPVNEKFKVKARFKLSGTINTIELATSDNKTQRYREYGSATFELLGKPNTLMLYQSAEFGGGNEPLFLGFTDETTGVETYAAGRYLDVHHDGSEYIELDFNKAYNPFCAYNEDYSCPIPPRQNHLSIALTAGEKDYKK